MSILYPDALAEAETELINIRRNAVGQFGDGGLPRVGLALSGGGIRSATFCLGVCQALAKTGLLPRIDFLSTVSGGGYCGSFLGRLFTRQVTFWADDFTNPEKLVSIIAAQSGALSRFLWANFETSEQTDLQNPGVSANDKRKILTRGFNQSLIALQNSAKTRREILQSFPEDRCRRWDKNSLPGSDVPAGASRFLLEQIFPSDDVRPSGLQDASETMKSLRDNGRYLSPNGSGDTWTLVAVFLRNWLAMLCSLFVFAVAGFLLLWLIRAFLWRFEWWSAIEVCFLEATDKHWWWSPVILLAGAVLAALAIPVGWAYWLSQITWSKYLKHVALITAAVVFGVAVFCAWRSAGLAATRTIAILVALQAGLAIVFYFICWRLTVDRGNVRDLSVRDAIYSIRNRLTKWFCGMLAIAVILLALAVVDSAGQSLYALLHEQQNLAEALVGLGGVMGWSALVVGASRLKFLLDLLPKNRAVQLPLEAVAGLAALLMVFALLTLAALAANTVAWRGLAPEVKIAQSPLPVRPGADLLAQIQSPARADRQSESGTNASASSSGAEQPDTASLAFAFSLAALLSWLTGQTLGFMNLSSLHALYTARLTRAYLGASNQQRRSGRGRSITDPIPDDDVQWTDYQPWLTGGPLHLVNATLNETVSGKSQIEFRDRKGLSFAVGPAGLSVGKTDHALWKKPASDHGDSDGASAGGSRESFNTSFWWGAKRPRLELEPLETLPGRFHALGIARQGADRAIAAPGKVHWCESASLGRWVAISGAAFTTGLGSRTSLAKSLLLGLLNVRLGYWWTSGIGPQERDEPCFELSDDQFINLALLSGKLRNPVRPIDRWLKERLSAATKEALERYAVDGPTSASLRTDLLRDLNRLIHGSSMYDMERFAGIRLRIRTKKLVSQNLNRYEVIQFNRLLLEDAYHQEFSRKRQTIGGRTPPRLSNRVEALFSWAFPVQMHLLHELTGRFFGPAMKRWYLSDGGHFENTAAYELLRRRLPYILVCDCGCDPDYSFDDLANLVRKARVDFGAEVEFLDGTGLEQLRVPENVRNWIGTPEEFRLEAKPGDASDEPRRLKHYALLARVRYSDGALSHMLFLKPGVTGFEPLDLLQYQTAHPKFPNESTADQYFDEAQWESYRKLGEHIARQILFPEPDWFLKLGTC